MYRWPCLRLESLSLGEKEGYGDLKNIDRSVDSIINAQIRFKLLGKSYIDHVKGQTARHNKKVRRKHEQGCFQDAYQPHCVLGMQAFAFRGHYERERSTVKGNFNEVAEVIARFNALLAEHIKRSTVFSWDVGNNYE